MKQNNNIPVYKPRMNPRSREKISFERSEIHFEKLLALFHKKRPSNNEGSSSIDKHRHETLATWSHAITILTIIRHHRNLFE